MNDMGGKAWTLAALVIGLLVAVDSRPLPAQVTGAGASGVAAGGKIDVLGRALNFKRVGTGTISTLNFQIRNFGEFRLHGNVDGSGLPPSLSLKAGAGPFNLGHHERQTVVVQAAPTQPGPFSGSIRITSGDSEKPVVSVPIMGTGIPAKITAARTVSFGRVKIGLTPVRTFRIRNRGAGVLQGSVGALDAPFSVTSGAGSFTLPYGRSLPVTVRFAPNSTQPAAGTLAITSDDPARPTVKVAVSGRGK
jgi:centrosomal CEP192-like protein